MITQDEVSHINEVITQQKGSGIMQSKLIIIIIIIMTTTTTTMMMMMMMMMMIYLTAYGLSPGGSGYNVCT